MVDWKAAQVAVHDGFEDDDYGIDTWMASKVHAFEAHLRDLGAPVELLVDFGCFSGALTRRFVPLARRVIGVDFHEQALAKARSRGLETIEHDLSAEAPLPIADGSVDVVTCADVVEHLLEPAVLLGHARRILRPGGSLLLSTPNLGYWLSRLRLLRGKAPLCTNGVSPRFNGDKWVDPSHIHVSVLSEWQGFFASEGWRVVSLRGSHLHYGGRRRFLAHALDALCDRYLPAWSLVPVMRLQRADGR